MFESSNRISDEQLTRVVCTFLEDAKNRKILFSPTAQRYVELLVRGWFYDPPLITRRPTLSLMTTLTELVLQEVFEDPHFEEEMSVRKYVSFSTLTYCLSTTTKRVMKRMELGFKRSEQPDDSY